MFCAVCLGVLQRLEGHIISQNGELTLLHHNRAESLKTAASSGCRICHAFWTGLSADQQTFLLVSDVRHLPPKEGLSMPDVEREDDEAWDARGKLLVSSAMLAMVSKAESMLKEVGEGCVLFCPLVNPERRMPEGAGSQAYGMFLLVPMSQNIDDGAQLEVRDHGRNTASHQSWEVVTGWIDNCLNTHTRCNELKGQGWYPTRLLDLEHSDDHVRLVETPTQPVTGRYMTLSHRWGSSNPLSLCRATKDSLMQALPLTDLPGVFQDAVTICKRLDIRYIWIDSLCILQDKDDLSDWTREAALMHQVYSHSFLNISALAAHDSSHSLFTEREPSVLENMTLMTALNGENISRDESQYRIVDIMFWEREMNLAHLNLRAWVLQERLLSPRVVHFARSQIFWECHELDAAESCRNGLPDVMEALRNVVRFKDIDSGKASRHAQQHESLGAAPYGVWTRIVRAYSRCGLTKKEDKLIALAGIAKKMTDQLDDEYVAGMWRRSLPWELTWSVDHPDVQIGERPRRATDYRAPSFSWASIDGPVSPSGIDGTRPLTNVLDVIMEYVTDDNTGLIKSGSLVLECQLQKLSLERNSHEKLDKIYTMYINGVQVCQPDGPEWERIGPVVTLDEERDVFDPTESETLYCVPAKILKEEKPMLMMLLLELVDREEATYRRIGVASSLKEVEIDKVLNEADGAESFPALSYHDGKHCIRLI